MKLEKREGGLLTEIHERSCKWRQLLEEPDFGHFMSIPSTQQRKSQWHQFYDATSNKALAMSVCAICGHELMQEKDRMVRLAWSALPAKERLIPTEQHPAQELFDGCLLCWRGLEVQGDDVYVWTCTQCLDHLRSGKKSPPMFSLANGLWVGEIPGELQGLTITEQKLIALVYPRMHVYKLYPKTYCGEEGLQWAMKGSLSTYVLNMEKIAHMIDGRLMPRHVDLLSSVITVLYIGPHKIPKEPLKYLLRVRREKVQTALIWLKKNNPKYFGDIEISEWHLASLPEDDVPMNLMTIIRQTHDESILDEENGGYVPTEEDFHDMTINDVGMDTGIVILLMMIVVTFCN